MPATLQVQQRNTATKPDAVRSQGQVPGVYYGPSEEATSIAMDKNDFLRTWREHGESSIITLERDDGDTVDTLIHDVQLDPVTDMPIHVDFYVFERGKTIQVSVPLEFEGEAPAVKEQNGILVKVLHNVTIEAMPKDLPQSISVDISSLVDFDTTITAGDLALPEGVELADDPEEVVASVDQPHEEPEEPEEEMSFEDIEVEGESKAEESEEGGEAENEQSGEEQ